MDKPVDLFITADHGSANEEAFKWIKKHIGCLIVCTDHHLIPEVGPTSADYFINPQRDDCTYSDKISGCVTVSLLMIAVEQYVASKQDREPIDMSFLEPLMAASTIADAMPLTDPLNRFMVNRGLEVMGESQLPCWSIYREKNKVDRFDSTEVSFGVAPLINSAGRMGETSVGTGFLGATTQESALENFKSLNRLNKERKVLQKHIYEMAEFYYVKNKLPNVIVAIVDDELGVGVGGIVASMLSEKYNQTAVVGSIIDGGSKVSCSFRAVGKDADIFKAINYCKEKMPSLGGGGHKGAGGAGFPIEELDNFRRHINDIIGQQTGGKRPKLNIECCCRIPERDIRMSTYEEIMTLSPFGQEWKQPILMSTLTIKYSKEFGVNAMYKFKTKDNGQIDAFFMGGAFTCNKFKSGDIVNVAYTMGKSTWGGKTSVSLMIREMKKVI
jgi:single-stranded-DNA-specific exonuclease